MPAAKHPATAARRNLRARGVRKCVQHGQKGPEKACRVYRMRARTLARFREAAAPWGVLQGIRSLPGVGVSCLMGITVARPPPLRRRQVAPETHPAGDAGG